MDPFHNKPACLVATLGTQPQVVTACATLLLRQGEALQEASVAYTSDPASAAAPAAQALRQAFAQPPYQDRLPLRMEAILSESGQPLYDVETPDAGRATFRCLFSLVRRAKQAGQRVHLCIAGGRKTMALYGMLAAQLLFDDDDRLWHLFSSGDFLESKRLQPLPGDQVHLIHIPVVLWSRISPVWLDLEQQEDPFEFLDRQRQRRLAERLEDAAGFLRGALTPAEVRVSELLATEGLSDAEIANRLGLSPRTVEQHLRSAYQKAAYHWELENVNRTILVSLLAFYCAVREER